MCNIFLLAEFILSVEMISCLVVRALGVRQEVPDPNPNLSMNLCSGDSTLNAGPDLFSYCVKKDDREAQSTNRPTDHVKG